MTPLQLARDECANFNRNGCLGIRPESLFGRTLPSMPLQSCRLMTSERCDYFEKLVLPLSPEVSDEYFGARGLIPKKIARRCECGEALKKHQRLCDKCKTIHRKEATRNAVNRHRCKKGVSCKQLSENGALQGNDL